MDGIHGKLESVLTIGATNLASELDGALLRPGRFEVGHHCTSPLSRYPRYCDQSLLLYAQAAGPLNG
jgi:hypothetical protein